MNFRICFAFVWFVVLQVMCDNLIFHYDNVRRWCSFCCFSLLGKFVISMLDSVDANNGTSNELLYDWFLEEMKS
jgi:hypothetical protein